MTIQPRKTKLLYSLLVCLLVQELFNTARAEDAGADDDDDFYTDDDGAAAGDDAYAYGVNDDGDDGNYDDAATDDSTQYWTDYSILPKRCFSYNNADMVMFSSYQYGYNQCIGSPLGTFVVPVAGFVEAYLDQAYTDAVDAGNDFEQPVAAQYLQCTQIQVEDGQYWAQLGCSEASSKALGVNLYSDNTCSTSISVEGWDGSDADISDLVLPFKKCQTCVSYVDHSDDAVDDQYYENKQTSSPLCSALWTYEQECDRSCQKMGHERFSSSGGWNTSDKVLLSIMSIFGFGMLVAILRKRRNMSRKELLLEEAAMSAAGLQLTHIIGIFVLVVIVIVVFALLGLKKITWALLILLTTVLFAYLMKLTVDGSMSQTCGDVCGPDATALPGADHITSTNHIATSLPLRAVV